MNITRYEWVLGEVKVGFFQGLDFLLPESHRDIDLVFEECLPAVPTWVYKKHRKAKAFFTELGVRVFSFDLNRIIDLIDGCGIMGAKISVTSVDDSTCYIVYKDKYQVVVRG